MVVPDSPRRAALLTLGCARNEVDSEELAGRLHGSGWELVDLDADDATPDVIVVNTCGFVEQAKKDSIDTLLAASDVAKESGAKVVAVGCLAERYGAELAESLPEADAVLGFDAYPDLATRLDGRPRRPRPGRARPGRPAHAAADLAGAAARGGERHRGARPRLGARPLAGAAVGQALRPVEAGLGVRPPVRVLRDSRRSAARSSPGPRTTCSSEAAWLAGQGVREVVLVSENSTSYGKDLPGGTRALVGLLPALAGTPGLDRVRVSYLQPAEVRPDLLTTIATTPGVAPYFDLSFQHASPVVLRRMRRFGSTEQFLDLCERIRALAPEAGIRSNVIVGFPGETDDDVAELEEFLTAARLDAVGVFGYSDEDGTEAAGYDGKVPTEEVAARVSRIAALVDELMAQRAEDRVGTEVTVLVDQAEDDDFECTGRAEHQAPEVDGECVLERGSGLEPGDLVRCRRHRHGGRGPAGLTAGGAAPAARGDGGGGGVVTVRSGAVR